MLKIFMAAGLLRGIFAESQNYKLNS